MTTKTTKTAARSRNKRKAGAESATKGLTMEQFSESYLRHLESKGKSRGTVFSYSIDIALAARELGKDTTITSLTPERVGAYFESDAVTKKRNGQAKAKPTIDKTRRVLRLALVWAAESGLIPEAPLPAPPAKPEKTDEQAKVEKPKRRRRTQNQPTEKKDATAQSNDATVEESTS